MAKIQYYIGSVKGTLAGDDQLHYIPKPFIYNTIDVSDLAEHIALDSHVERANIQVIVDSLIKQIREMVLNGHPIDVPHLGRFKPGLRSKQAYNELFFDINQSSVKIMFQPSEELKKDLKSVRFEKMDDKNLLRRSDDVAWMPGYWPSADPEQKMFLSAKNYQSDSFETIYMVFIPDENSHSENSKLIEFKPEWAGKFVTAEETAGEDEVTKAEIIASAVAVDQNLEDLTNDHKILYNPVDTLLDYMIEHRIPFTKKRLGSYAWADITTT